MKKKIKIGISNRVGDILEDYEKAKACNFCTRFLDYGLHQFAGKCKVTGEDINYQDYSKMALESLLEMKGLDERFIKTLDVIYLDETLYPPI